MASYDQIPGTLNIDIVAGDSVSIAVDFDTSLVGHSVAASITSVVSGLVVASLDTAVVSAAAGTVTISMTAEQTAALAHGTYRWELTWVSGAVTRKALSGFFEVRNR
jgi:hypothetical protein